MFTTTDKFQQQIKVKMESQTYEIPTNPFAIRLAKHMGLEVKSWVQSKKQNELSITLISGPHVHKKSRDQYKIVKYSAFFIINIRNQENLKTFLEYKKRLFLLHADEEFKFSFTYIKEELMESQLFLCSLPSTVLPVGIPKVPAVGKGTTGSRNL
jgi:ribosomal protein S10